MNLFAFSSFILVLCFGWMQFYSAVREQFNGVAEYKAASIKAHRQLERERLAWNLEKDQFLEFRQNVATLMPETVKQKGQGLSGYPYRSLASVITKPQSNKIKDLIAKSLFEQGKKHFRNKKYEQSAKLFKDVIAKYSYTTYVNEAYFLLAEGYFQQGQYEESTRTIQQMLELFPAHELTGFSLIRLGKIYEVQNRNEEAIDIYKTVMRSFPQRDVAGQAKASLKGVEL